MFICVCNAVTERAVLTAVAEGAGSLADLQGQLGLATCCGACAELAQEYLPGGAYAAQAESTPASLMAQAATLVPLESTFVAHQVSRRAV